MTTDRHMGFHISVEMTADQVTDWCEYHEIGAGEIRESIKRQIKRTLQTAPGLLADLTITVV